jgi:hypothetical protein
MGEANCKQDSRENARREEPLARYKRTREDNIKMFWEGIITYLSLLRHALLRKENIKEEYTHRNTDA